MKLNLKNINFKKLNGLIPAIVQDNDTDKILMLGFMNKESVAKTIKTNKVWFYSRTKKKLWMKGKTSGNVLSVLWIKSDCDNDTLLIKAKPAGPTCHKGEYSCFGENKKTVKSELLQLFEVIKDRKEKMPKKSYTTSLFKAGLDKISLKIAEEALEVVHAAQKETKKRLIEETVDLIYHLFVLLVDKKISISEIETEIKKRQKN